jgi:excisionase family DNA binding protein
MATVEEVITSSVRMAVREEVRNAMREMMAELKPMSTDSLLTTEEAAHFTKLHPETLRQLVREKRLPRRKIGQEYRFKREELEAFLSKDETPRPDNPEVVAAAILAKTRERR